MTAFYRRLLPLPQQVHHEAHWVRLDLLRTVDTFGEKANPNSVDTFWQNNKNQRSKTQFFGFLCVDHPSISFHFIFHLLPASPQAFFRRLSTKLRRNWICIPVPRYIRVDLYFYFLDFQGREARRSRSAGGKRSVPPPPTVHGKSRPKSEIKSRRCESRTCGSMW